jgi:hypothetical protein
MQIRLTYDEVIKALSEYASKRIDFRETAESIENTHVFIVEDNEGKQVEYNSVEFEFACGVNE